MLKSDGMRYNMNIRYEIRRKEHLFRQVPWKGEEQEALKAPFSNYLTEIAPGLKALIASLGEHYEYVSALSTDSRGFMVRVSKHAKSVNGRTMTTERGTVIRVMRGGLYSEYAFNEFDPLEAIGKAGEIRAALDRQLALMDACGVDIYKTGPLEDEPLELFAEMETGTLPEETDFDELIRQLTEVSKAASGAGEHVIDCHVVAQSTHISKLFLTKNRDLRQSYVYSEASVMPIGAKDGRNEMAFSGISGRKGPELFEELPALVERNVRKVGEMLDAKRVEPGEYEIITTPGVSGLIAHEAFGHGVEMDMFVKGRALGADYIGKRVGSDLVTMHEGAACAVNVTSYAFDDEGTLAGDVTEIDRGILKNGICDALAAKRLGTAPTGNGKRENFEHKVYTRMTNTLFDSGSSSLDEMIASISHGYLLDGSQSGMEDPKHWGIQCMVQRGYEIVDGKLSGKVVAPVCLTGYVPDLLGSISMVSTDREVFGNGGCGKGHKEWVKVADGGPYLKARARLG